MRLPDLVPQLSPFGRADHALYAVAMLNRQRARRPWTDCAPLLAWADAVASRSIEADHRVAWVPPKAGVPKAAHDSPARTQLLPILIAPERRGAIPNRDSVTVLTARSEVD